ncbi:MAG TPA: sulfite exporter TauE/SafE family protein, partial [Luteimonas sp.]|nr:sulfite exporter TauE/SafE family protein [Luteimonas sp.]
MFPLPDLTPDQIQAIIPFIFIGFLAQLVDGALGMAFGVITNTLLVSVLGIPPARASASVHLVEAFTTGASGLSHILHDNVDWALFRRLAIPGVIGGVLGAYVLSSIDGKVAR